MYAKNCWYVAGWQHDFTGDRLYPVLIANSPIVLYRKTDGVLVALEDRCRHRFAPLSLGCREGDDLRCLYHGMKYAPSGKCIEIPGEDKIPSMARVTAYAVQEKHSWVWIWLGDPEQADVELIPPALSLDHPGYVFRHGHIDYDAPFHLINDNLLDLAHISYLHRSTFGTSTSFATTPQVKITQQERGVRVDRWIENMPRRMGAGEALEPRDVYAGALYLVPGVMLLLTGGFPAGTARSVNGGTPDMSAAIASSFSAHVITPITASTSRYFYSWGSITTQEIAEAHFKITQQAFTEDKVMVEAQYRTMQAGPHPSVMAKSSDEALLIFQKIMRSMTSDGPGERSAQPPGVAAG